MLKITNGFDSAIIVLHEIYGINEHMKTVCKEYSEAGYDIICPDLIKHKPFSYEQQEEAYRYYLDNIGFESAFAQVKKLMLRVRKQYRNVFILGYSVGATIAWMCSEATGLCDGVVGYYGSRIRDYMDVVPQCPVLLVFPNEEESFNVEETVGLLKEKKARVYIFNAKHGFGDPFSGSYSMPKSEESKKLTDDFLKRIRVSA